MLGQALPNARRRSFRLSVRALIVLVLAVGAGLGWVRRILPQARHQQKAVKALQAAGADVWYDWEWRGDKPVRGRRPAWREWLMAQLGEDFFARAIAVDLELSSNDAMRYLGRLEYLEVLFARGVAFANGGLPNLKGLASLRSLDLSETDTTGDGLSKLQDLRMLESLKLCRTPINDRGLAYISMLTRLRSLDLSFTPIGDRGLCELSGLQNLEELKLDHSAITDDGLPYLRQMTHLRSLSVANTDLDDMGLVHLQALKSLTFLDLGSTHVTFFGVRGLRQAIPKVKVVTHVLDLQ